MEVWETSLNDPKIQKEWMNLVDYPSCGGTRTIRSKKKKIKIDCTGVLTSAIGKGELFYQYQGSNKSEQKGVDNRK